MIWQQILRKNFRDWDKLAAFLELTPSQQEQVLPHSHFPLNLPLRLAEKISKGTLDDPLLKQFLPTRQETIISPDYVADPVADTAFRRESKLLQKYEGRVLLVCSSACAMHCRYCFRQNFPYETENKSFTSELQQIAEDDTLQEVILSGGDPLSLSDTTLRNLLQSLALIPHIKRIRFHTRFPVGIPERIDAGFLSIFDAIPQRIFFVLHINHSRELDEELFLRLQQLQKLGITLLNQSVLLKGVNDDVATLQELSECLVNHGVMPYYLHQLDRVQGAAHFEVEPDRGRLLIEQLSAKLSGYAVPKYVQELPGRPHKTPL